MKYIISAIAILAIVASLTIHAAFTDVNAPAYHGKTNIKPLTSVIDANFAMIESGTVTTKSLTSTTVLGAEAGDASVIVDADEGDDNADTWTIRSTSSDNDLDILNHTSVLATIDTNGLIFTTVGLDAIGAVDMDYGSADVTDHTFTTDGTGDAEVVLPDGSIGSAEILDGAVAAADLATAVQDQIAYITVAGADLAAAGTGTLTIQLKDAAGNDLAAAGLVRVWIGTADDYGVDALTDFSVSTGTQKEEVTADGEYLAITDGSGTIVMAIDNGGAGTVYAWAELGGRIVASGAIVLTAP